MALKAPLPAHRGYTLIEMIVAMAILGIVATTAIPSFADVLQTRRLDGAATQLAADLQFARGEAVARNEPVRWSLYTDERGSCYVLHTRSPALCHCNAETPAQCEGGAQPLKTVGFPVGDRITLLSNVTTLLFDPLHGTSSPAASMRVVDAKAREVRQVVNLMGRVRSCSPQQAVPGYRAC